MPTDFLFGLSDGQRCVPTKRASPFTMQRRPARHGPSTAFDKDDGSRVASSRRRKRTRRPKLTPCAATIAACSFLLLMALVVGSILLRRGYFAGMDTAEVRAQASKLVLDNKMLQKLRGHSAKQPLRMSTSASAPSFPKYPRQDHVHVSSAVLEMCTNTLWHTLETTTIVLPDGETFVHTGDIDDLWLRDSASQIHPLLVGTNPLIAQDAKLDRIVSGLIKRCAMYIRHDPYANAFRIDDTYVFNDMQKALGRHDLISTWNYELDSACFYMRMLYYYWKQSPRGSFADSVLRLQSVQEAVEIMVDLWVAEQQHELDQFPIGSLFDCQNCNKPYRYPGLPRNGKGSPTNATAGMSWTGFRPSDDECMYGYLVPANMFAVVVLEYIVEMANDLWHTPALALKAGKLAKEIDQSIQEHGIVDHPQHGRVYAYEVDGLGSYNLMDDANVPSLLSAPYLGYHVDEAVYANTRNFIFSKANPTFRKGTNGLTGEIEGYGSVHMVSAIQDNIWPMALAVRGLVSDSVQEKIELAETLVKASAGTGWMHESFDVRNPKRFTRSWFCWADSLFAELVLSITDECPLMEHTYKVHEWRDPVRVAGGVFAMD